MLRFCSFVVMYLIPVFLKHITSFYVHSNQSPSDLQSEYIVLLLQFIYFAWDVPPILQFDAITCLLGHIIGEYSKQLLRKKRIFQIELLLINRENTVQFSAVSVKNNLKH